MQKLFYSATLGLLLVISGCGDKKDEPKPVEPEQVHVVVTATETGGKPGANLRMTLSQDSHWDEVETGYLFDMPLHGNTSRVMYDEKLNKSDMYSKTLYIGLYYQDVTGTVFRPPTGADRAEVNVMVDGKKVATVALNTADYTNIALRWRDLEGKTRIGREVAFTY